MNSFLKYCVFFALTPFYFINAQVPTPHDYTGYTYVNYFTGGNLGGGSISHGTGTILNATPGFLNFDCSGGQSGVRDSRFNFSSVNFTKKIIVEFDWKSNNLTGGGDEGLIQFRNGTNANGTNVLFTLYNLRTRPNEIRIATGAFAAGGAWQTVDAGSYTDGFSYITGKWYHLKAEIYAGHRMCFTITDEDGFHKQIMLPVPTGFNLNNISNIYFYTARTTANIYWLAGVANIGIKTVNDEEPATGVTIAATEEQIGPGGSTSLTATVEPWEVYNHNISWSVDNDLATITAGVPSWTATLKGANKGFGPVTVIATSATAGVTGTKVIDIVDLKLSNIVISGPNTVSVNNTVQLSANVSPEGASNLNVVWSSDDENIAVVDPVTGEVKGVATGVASIRATAADGGGATKTYDVTVVFMPVTDIDLYGARRMFYGANPASTEPFILTPVFVPADASTKTLEWSSTDINIATVDHQGYVTLAGGFGKAAIKAKATDDSDVERYYYIEVAQVNPYDAFGDFELNAAPFNSISDDANGRALFQGTQVIQFYQQQQTGYRRSIWTLSNSNITGRKINLRFDWWAGEVRDQNNTVVLSIQDQTNDPANSLISFVTSRSEDYGYFRYAIGNYEETSEGMPTGVAIEGIERFDRWYTVDMTFDFQEQTCSFTITERDDPSITQTITDIPLSPADLPDPRIARLYVVGSRVSGDLYNRTAIDNFGYKVVDAAPPSFVITGLELNGLDHVAPGEKIMLYPKFTPDRATNKNLTYLSSNPEIAAVELDNSGRAIVTGISEGTVTIMATSVENEDIFAEKIIAVTPVILPQRLMERIDRGLVAVKVTGGVFLSWRLLSTDPEDITFNIYKNNGQTPVNVQPLKPAYTDFTDPAGTSSDTYTVAVLANDREIYRSKNANVWANQYLSIPVKKPTTGRLNTNGNPYSADNYTIYDGAVADLDGDGEYEIVFLWAPNNLHDNAHDGETGTVFIDAYKLDGTKLWGSDKYIDLGRNIRAGAHYLPFLVFDFDGDGKAEIVIRTADGTTDAQGRMIGNDVAYANAYGRVLTGPEYVAIFEGATGKLLDYAPYEPPRGNVQDWGDGNGNRADRFLACVAYLDGVHPSAVMTRGYYTRTTLTAWDWDGAKLTKRWMFDSREAGKQYEDQGNHNLSVADVNGDGKDEIIYGSLTVNHDGTALYTTGYRHGDAMHAGKFDPDRPGLQIMGVHETPLPWGMEMHDAMTGDLIWGVTGSGDIGRGLTADIDPNYPGAESWSAGGLGTYSVNGQKLGGSLGSINMAIYWDGDTGRELFDGGANPSVTKPSGSGTPPNRSYSNPSIFTFNGASTNGGSKNNPCLQADILGDWREELILRANNDNELRIYTTVTPTVHSGAGAVPESGIPALMHDKTYRMAVAWQNVGYNQPPHTGFFLGYNMENVPRTGGAVIAVTIDPNGGTFADNTTATKQLTTISGAYFNVPEVSRPEIAGSVFHGWYLNDDEKYDPTAIYQEDIVLKAKWSPVAYIVSFDANTTGMTNPKSKLVVYNAAIGALPVLTRTGYTLSGWYPNPDGTGGAFAETTVLESNITLYAQWTPKTYTLSFETQTSEVTKPDNQSAFYDVEVGELPVLSRAGYTFGGWFINENGTGPITETTVYRYDRNMPLYAKWTPKTYTLSFDTNVAGMTNPESRQVTYDAAVGVLPVLTRAGYNFAGWNAASGGNGETYTATTLYRTDGNLTLYAVWNPLTGISELVWDNLKVYPNPASNVVTVSGLDGGELISFLDAAGRLCIQIKAAGFKEDINVSDFPHGAYLIKVEKHNAEKTVKLVVE